MKLFDYRLRKKLGLCYRALDFGLQDRKQNMIFAFLITLLTITHWSVSM